MRDVDAQRRGDLARIERTGVLIDSARLDKQSHEIAVRLIELEREAYELGFTHAAVGAMVRSSYHADVQAHAALNAAG